MALILYSFLQFKRFGVRNWLATRHFCFVLNRGVCISNTGANMYSQMGGAGQGGTCEGEESVGYIVAIAMAMALSTPNRLA